jgi:hypothetical protein
MVWYVTGFAQVGSAVQSSKIEKQDSMKTSSRDVLRTNRLHAGCSCSRALVEPAGEEAARPGCRPGRCLPAVLRQAVLRAGAGAKALQPGVLGRHHLGVCGVGGAELPQQRVAIIAERALGRLHLSTCTTSNTSCGGSCIGTRDSYDSAVRCRSTLL